MLFKKYSYWKQNGLLMKKIKQVIFILLNLLKINKMYNTINKVNTNQFSVLFMLKTFSTQYINWNYLFLEMFKKTFKITH